MDRIRSSFVATLLATILVSFAAGNALAQNASAPPAAAPSVASPMQVPQPGSNVNWPGAGYGAVALFGNLLYFPAKLVYATLGTIVGGGTYLVTAGNVQAASTVWRSALGGDYVLTPQMVAGEQPINFTGPTETPPPAANVDASAPASSTVQPITPLPPPSSAPAAAPSISSATSQPMDAGTGPIHSKAESGSPKGSIE
jgi:hypothetical protein